MTKRIAIVGLLAAFLATEATAQYHQNRRRGVILGGLAGAAIGAAIGDKGDNETAGALIGGAVGAIAGGTIGHQQDQRIEHNRRYHSNYGSGYASPYSGGGYYGQNPTGQSRNLPHYYQPYVYEQQPVPHEPTPVVISPPPPSILVNESGERRSTATTVTKADVLKMVRSGMSETIIIRQLELHGMDRALTVPEVIELHEAGVSDAVLETMQLSAPEAANKRVSSSSPQSVPGNSTKAASSTTGLLPPPPPRPQLP